jgi:hypothetical protein
MGRSPARFFIPRPVRLADRQRCPTSTSHAGPDRFAERSRVNPPITLAPLTPFLSSAQLGPLQMQAYDAERIASDNQCDCVSCSAESDGTKIDAESAGM